VVGGPVVVLAGTNKVFPLNLRHGGRMDVTLQNLMPDFTGLNGFAISLGKTGFILLCAVQPVLIHV
jgi:hypothetical protein